MFFFARLPFANPVPTVLSCMAIGLFLVAGTASGEKPGREASAETTKVAREGQDLLQDPKMAELLRYSRVAFSKQPGWQNGGGWLASLGWRAWNDTAELQTAASGAGLDGAGGLGEGSLSGGAEFANGSGLGSSTVRSTVVFPLVCFAVAIGLGMLHRRMPNVSRVTAGEEQR